MKETGSIKFNCEWIKTGPLPYSILSELNQWRDKLYDLKLLGENEDGIGYGNISMRYKKNTFIITGSATGKLEQLDEKHYTVVTKYNLDTNSLTTKGPILASSESMTHAVIYETLAAVNSVMHVHHYALWEKLLQTNPSTARNVEYGTPTMAREIQRLLKESNLLQVKLFAMGGHEEGIIAFGNTIEEAGCLIVNALNSLI